MEIFGFPRFEVGYLVRKDIQIYAGYRGRYGSGGTNDVAVHGWMHGPLLGTFFNF